MVIPKLRGFALAEYITSPEVSRKIGGGGIFFTQVMEYLAVQEAGKQVSR